MSKAEKTRHLINQLEGDILGFSTEVTKKYINLSHIKKSEKELSELEAKATAYDNAKEDLELAQAVRWISEQRLWVEMGYMRDFLTEDTLLEIVKMYKKQKGE